MELTHFGGLALPGGDEDVAFPFAARSNLVVLRDGAFDADGMAGILSPLAISRTFKITAPDFETLNDTLDNLMRAFAGGRKVLQARWRDGTRRQTFAKVTNVTRPRRRDDRTYQEITVDFQLDYPYWLDTDDEPRYLDNSEYLDHGWYVDDHYDALALAAATQDLTITNGGTMPVRRGQVVITPTAGGRLEGLTITNAANLMQLEYTGAIEDGETLVLDLLPKSAKLDAVNAYAGVVLPSGQMDWMILEVGENVLTVELDDFTTGGTLDWHWSKHWV